ncbi:MAG TPA: hypothetical protein VKU90_16430 [Caulobacteraceae bacterium]|nr:hypothetical protein [Caulobacteraceae bacterium]
MTSLIDRYHAGECAPVWAELMALGAAVYEAPHAEPAWAVARETMRRARSNLDALIERLDGLGYQFWDGVQGPTRGPRRAVTFGERRLEAASTDALLGEMFQEARALPASALTGVMVEQLHNIYRTAVWPWQDTAQLVKGVRLPADAAATSAFEQAKRSPPVEVATSQLGELERLCAASVEALSDAWKARQSAQPAPTIDHRTDAKVWRQPRKKDLALLARIEKAGPTLPLALRAWIEEVGGVCLAGSHPDLCFWEDAAFPGIYADPLMAAIDLSEIEAWASDGRKGALDVVVGWDARAKARLTIEDRELDDGYAVSLPAAAADAALSGDAPGATFVGYLRQAFRWGGFPGWTGRADAPSALIDQLTRDLAPI